jgi:hypothetical protein
MIVELICISILWLCNFCLAYSAFNVWVLNAHIYLALLYFRMCGTMFLLGLGAGSFALIWNILFWSYQRHVSCTFPSHADLMRAYSGVCQMLLSTETLEQFWLLQRYVTRVFRYFEVDNSDLYVPKFWDMTCEFKNKFWKAVFANLQNHIYLSSQSTDVSRVGFF